MARHVPLPSAPLAFGLVATSSIAAAVASGASGVSAGVAGVVRFAAEHGSVTSVVAFGATMLALVFTAALLLIMLAGSIWVMFHLNTNMMPHGPQEMRVMP